MFAHSLSTTGPSTWEPLSDHLAAVARRTARFAEPFGWAEAGKVVGLLHDIGKVSAVFQTYIGQPRTAAGGPTGPDHSTAGAREAAAYVPAALGRMLAGIIAGHHAGLDDATGLDRRLGKDHPIPSYTGWSEMRAKTDAPTPCRRR